MQRLWVYLNFKMLCISSYDAHNAFQCFQLWKIWRKWESKMHLKVLTVRIYILHTLHLNFDWYSSIPYLYKWLFIRRTCSKIRWYTHSSKGSTVGWRGFARVSKLIIFSILNNNIFNRVYFHYMNLPITALNSER